MVESTAAFGPEFESVAEARRFVRRVLSEWGHDEAEPIASLLVTELATNSVLHARTEFRVVLSFDGDTLRIGVADGSARRPADKAHSVQATTGRGIPLIAAYADAWGVDPLPGGKTVWCVLRRDQAPDAADRAGRTDDATRAVRAPRPSADGGRQTTMASEGHPGGAGRTAGLGWAA